MRAGRVLHGILCGEFASNRKRGLKDFFVGSSLASVVPRVTPLLARTVTFYSALKPHLAMNSAISRNDSSDGFLAITSPQFGHLHTSPSHCASISHSIHLGVTLHHHLSL